MIKEVGALTHRLITVTLYWRCRIFAKLLRLVWALIARVPPSGLDALEARNFSADARTLIVLVIFPAKGIGPEIGVAVLIHQQKHLLKTLRLQLLLVSIAHLPILQPVIVLQDVVAGPFCLLGYSSINPKLHQILQQILLSKFKIHRAIALGVQEASEGVGCVEDIVVRECLCAADENTFNTCKLRVACLCEFGSVLFDILI